MVVNMIIFSDINLPPNNLNSIGPFYRVDLNKPTPNPISKPNSYPVYDPITPSVALRK